MITREARERGVHLGLVSATLARESSRRSLGASALLRDAYAALDAVGAIDEADADRLVQLGVRPQTITVTGDTRYDQVRARAQTVDRESPLLRRLRGAGAIIVAGSTWPSDEAVLLPAFDGVRRTAGDARLIIAAHEPTEKHVNELLAWAQRSALRADRLGEATSDTDVVIVDRVGVLGDLYALADVAFVGGGFHAAGLHSVLEPAAFGAPVLFGPRFQNSRDAALLAQRHGGASVADVAEAERRLRFWVTDPVARREAGDFARALVRSGVGAAERSFSLVDRLLR